MEQSDSKRFRARLPVAFAREGCPGQARGLVYNLSIEGCKVTSDTRVAPGTYLTLRLYLPAPHAPVEIRLAAVRWTMQWDFGVTFVNMQSEELQRLNRYLADLETAGAAL
ncbi:MAG: PilZ domain-containing protein [Nitrospirae bacterium]|nr:PilZ domain-containing protein [Nitrospirota bacterium]